MEKGQKIVSHGDTEDTGKVKVKGFSRGEHGVKRGGQGQKQRNIEGKGKENEKGIRLLPGINIPTGEGLPFVGKARQSEHSRAYVTFGATQQTDGKTSQGGIIISRNSLK